MVREGAVLIIEVKNLTKYYGSHPALRNISFAVGEGDTVGFLGANGAGKSTTMRILTGFLTPTSGSVRVAGCDMAVDSFSARQQIGYLPENTPLYKDMRVLEFLNYRARLKGIARRERKSAIAMALKAAHVEEVSRRVIGQLSKGYRQRVGLADCVLGRPRLLILDEPTVGLDPNQVIETRDMIRELGGEHTVFLSTHLLHEVEQMCEQVIIIAAGEIVAAGKTRELCEQYADSREICLQIIATGDVKGTLEPIKGIRTVSENPLSAADGSRGFIVRCSRGEDPRRTIAEQAIARGWLIQEMRMEPIRLEDIFAQLTIGEGATK